MYRAVQQAQKESKRSQSLPKKNTKLLRCGAFGSTRKGAVRPWLTSDPNLEKRRHFLPLQKQCSPFESVGNSKALPVLKGLPPGRNGDALRNLPEPSLQTMLGMSNLTAC